MGIPGIDRGTAGFPRNSVFQEKKEQAVLNPAYSRRPFGRGLFFLKAGFFLAGQQMPNAAPEGGQPFPVFDLQFLERFSDGTLLGDLYPGKFFHGRRTPAQRDRPAALTRSNTVSILGKFLEKHNRIVPQGPVPVNGPMIDGQAQEND
jgi:hypothetical protein